ncbi:MAG: glycosyltransferase family 2 protein [Vicinamibacteria bacterium]|nr:glycosyltransferase family 2 protein [Vicinamibacteria bacterium]
MNGNREERLEIVMPVCNEGATIASTLREWHETLSPRIDLSLVVAEDGSRDNTKDVLRALRGELPLLLDMTDRRRGYGGAVLAALRATSGAHVLAVDSDGQCDPRDFWPFWDNRDRFDMLIGWRVRRGDNIARRIMSRSFKLLHWILFRIRLHDPSCPYVLVSRSLLDRLLPELGTLTEGFWWEFVARAAAHGAKIGEVPIAHRLRAHGTTVVFKPTNVPRIAWRNGMGLLRVFWRQHGSGCAVVETIAPSDE